MTVFLLKPNVYIIGLVEIKFQLNLLGRKLHVRFFERSYCVTSWSTFFKLWWYFRFRGRALAFDVKRFELCDFGEDDTFIFLVALCLFLGWDDWLGRKINHITVLIALGNRILIHGRVYFYESFWFLPGRNRSYIRQLVVAGCHTSVYLLFERARKEWFWHCTAIERSIVFVGIVLVQYCFFWVLFFILQAVFKGLLWFFERWIIQVPESNLLHWYRMVRKAGNFANILVGRFE